MVGRPTIGWVLMMIDVAGMFARQILIQRPSAEDVHDLQTTAYAEHRFVACNGTFKQREFHLIPRIAAVQIAVSVRFTVACRIHVMPTSHHKAVAPAEDLPDLLSIGRQCRHERHCTGLTQCIHVPGKHP